jgi:hypothetical protein
MYVTQARKLIEIDKENIRMKKLVADLFLDNAILKEVLGKYNLTRQETRGYSPVHPALDVAESRVCRVAGLPRSTQRHHKQPVMRNS